jgi:hypothetical protein
MARRVLGLAGAGLRISANIGFGGAQLGEAAGNDLATPQIDSLPRVFGVAEQL